MNENQPTIQDVLEAINSFAGNVENRFVKIDEKFDKIDERFVKIDEKFDRIDEKFAKSDSNFSTINGQLARLETKMDEGFGSIRSEMRELRGELIERIDRLEKRAGEDTDATIQDYINLKQRVDVLERTVRQMAHN